MELSAKIIQALEKEVDMETVPWKMNPASFAETIKTAKKERDETFQELISRMSLEKGNIPEVALLVRVYSKKDLNCPLIDLDPECKSQHKASIENLYGLWGYEKGKRIFKKAKSAAESADRNRWLEKAIRTLLSLFDTKKDNTWKYPRHPDPNLEKEARKCISKAYFTRGLGILPRGKGVSPPEKKKDAFQKALEWNNSVADGEIQNTLERIHILHELCRLEPDQYQSALEGTCSLPEVQNFAKETAPADSYDLFILDTIARFSHDPDTKTLADRKISDSSPEIQNPAHFHPPLYALRALLRMNRSQGFSDYIRQLKDKLEDTELFFPLWEDVTALIRDMKDQEKGEWKTLCLAAWEICREKENLLGFGLEIRQHWSRMDSLYKFALDAAWENDDRIRSAEIMDSLKSRTTLTWKETDEVLLRSHPNAEKIRELRKKYYENEAQAAQGQFVERYKETKKKLEEAISKLGSRPFKSNALDLHEIPKGWTAVHLYMDEKLQARAVWGNSDDKEEKWEKTEFNAKRLWEDYQQWFLAYQNKKFESFQELKALCKEIGKSMEFLFTRISTKGIIFIPHGFLHLLPLHAALDQENRCLMEEKICIYLPAWSYARAEVHDSHQKTKGRFCFRYCPDAQKEWFYKDLFADPFWDEKGVDDAGGEIFSCFQKKHFADTPPAWFAVLCHGEADEVNPFKSALLLKDHRFELLDLQLENLSLSGTNLMLGACETELTPPMPGQVDEHLGLAGIFLLKGARVVLGTLWECEVNLSGEVIKEAMEEKATPWEILFTKQSGWMGDTPPQNFQDGKDTFQEYEPDMKLYWAAPFRLTGFPQGLPEDEDHGERR